MAISQACAKSSEPALKYTEQTYLVSDNTHTCKDSINVLSTSTTLASVYKGRYSPPWLTMSRKLISYMQQQYAHHLWYSPAYQFSTHTTNTNIKAMDAHAWILRVG